MTDTSKNENTPASFAERVRGAKERLRKDPNFGRGEAYGPVNQQQGWVARTDAKQQLDEGREDGSQYIG